MAMREKKVPRIEAIMNVLQVTARALSRESGVDNTLISRWQKGTRPLSRRSKQLEPVAEALLRLDAEGKLHAMMSEYRKEGQSPLDTLCDYLVDETPVLRTPPLKPVLPQRSGEYTAEYRVLLGKKGFRRAALAMMDEVHALPPGQQITVLCQGQYEWITGNLPFVLQFITKMRSAIGRGTQLQLINRKGYSVSETAAFALPWLIAHLRGYIRSRYYEGDLPEALRFAAVIPGFWCGRAEEEEEAEDGLYVALHTDPREVRQMEGVIGEYHAKSFPASQYGFLKEPLGSEERPRLWQEGPLPPWHDGNAPDGSFFAISRVPGFGIMTHGEFDAVRGTTKGPDFPAYMLRDTPDFAPGPHRIILCREDVREGLAAQRQMHDALSALLGRRAFVPRQMLAAQIGRLVEEMSERDDFEVALVPRAAFEKLQLELVCFRDSVSVGWLQDMSESVFANDRATSGSFYGAIDFAWDKLLNGWKRKDVIYRQLRKWLRGKELNASEKETAAVLRWEVLPQDEKKK